MQTSARRLPNPPSSTACSTARFTACCPDQLSAFWQRLDPAAELVSLRLGEERRANRPTREHVAAFTRRDRHPAAPANTTRTTCGIVYADDLDNPSLIKIYDPSHLGTSCGSSKHRILPGWVMSKMPPSDLSPSHLVPQNRKRWWQASLT